MTAIILAGGRGTRLGDLYPDLPKPLIQVCGKPFLHWITGWVAAQGETRLVFSVGYLAEKIAGWAGEEAEDRPGLDLEVIKEDTPLGTGGAAVFCAARIKDECYLILNGDSFIATELRPAYDRLADDAELDGIVVAVAVDDTSRYGSLDIGEDGVLKGFYEKHPGHGYINAGIYLLRRDLLDVFQSGTALSIEHDCFPRWIADERRIGVLRADAPFLDIGTPESLALAESFIADHASDSKLLGEGR